MADDPIIRPRLRLMQKADGIWVCRTPHLPMSFTEGATPDEAVAKMMRGLEDFREFKAHIRGNCGPECGRCARGETKTKGVWGDDT